MSDEKMTATERLRQLLDKRGVEHIDYKDEATWWSNGDVECAYIQSAIFNDELGQLSFMATPEQAVEATLRRGTCKVVSKPCDIWECSECGKTWWHGGAPNYCPSCGRVAVLSTPTDNATLSDLFGIWKEDE